ncbi:hypothetical protein Abr02nite_26390 [Paractinoplanes brasiliensis]|nr:hypothetical protein Abr02nite_26390 [Actinoplanes brasiliensis]
MPHQQAAQPPQMLDGVDGRVADQLGDLAQPETETPVREHFAQPFHVGRGVRPIPGRRSPGRPQQADLVVVMQRAHGDAGKLGHPPHAQVLVHEIDYGP